MRAAVGALDGSSAIRRHLARPARLTTMTSNSARAEFIRSVRRAPSFGIQLVVHGGRQRAALMKRGPAIIAAIVLGMAVGLWAGMHRRSPVVVDLQAAVALFAWCSRFFS